MKIQPPINQSVWANTAKYIASVLLLNSCCITEAKKFDFTRLVVVGDSLMAGFRDGGLMETHQQTSIPALIAHQARTELPQPLIAYPGIPNVLEIVDPGPPPVIERVPGISSGRLDLFEQAQNLSVPGHSVKDALSTRPDFPIDNLTDVILGLPGLLGGVSKSQVEWAEALQPTTVLVWLGANDALGAAQTGLPEVVTPFTDFAADYDEVIDRLAATGASLVIANVPDVTVVPYLTSFSTVAQLTGLPPAILSWLLGIQEGDYLTPEGVASAMAILQGLATGPLADNEVLDAGEVTQVQIMTQQYNEFISQKAAEVNAVLVDTHGLLNGWKEENARFGNSILTTSYLGGIFSLDGLHASLPGAILTANEFISEMNRHGAGLPKVPWVIGAEKHSSLLEKWLE